MTTDPKVPDEDEDEPPALVSDLPPGAGAQDADTERTAWEEIGFATYDTGVYGDGDQ